jgi:type IV secretion system protein VirB9
VVAAIHYAAVGVCAVLQAMCARAETIPAKGLTDSRVRVAAYNAEEVYRLQGHIGYQIDLQFEAGEVFIGLGAGDLEGLSFSAQDNHLFLKPKVARVRTNLTVLTNRRHYQIEYTAVALAAEGGSQQDMIYALRFTYPAAPDNSKAAEVIEARLANPDTAHPRNVDYWYCGDPSIRPVAASDDGIHTRLRFGAHSEQPAIFVRNDDGSESLLNFSMDAGDVIVHRVARQFIVRRGQLTGCIVNKGFSGSGERLLSGTVAPNVERTTSRGTP